MSEKPQCTRCRCYRPKTQFEVHADGTLYKTCNKCRATMDRYKKWMKGTSEDRRTYCYVGKQPRNTRLTIEDVRYIRGMHPFEGRGRRDNMMTINELAEKFGVHRGTIESILSGKSWSSHW